MSCFQKGNVCTHTSTIRRGMQGEARVVEGLGAHHDVGQDVACKDADNLTHAALCVGGSGKKKVKNLEKHRVCLV